MIEDAELLRRYAENRSEDSFAELVRRRVNLVYSVALRQVGGDAQLAEDVTQRVFTDLARKAKQLSQHAVLSGWLYRSAQFAASDVVRAERRRRHREQEARIMNEISSPDAPADWEQLRSLLDQVLGELDDEDRDALALRFFEERSFAEVGGAVRLTEDAARKRVSRALDKLHGLLARRGVTSTTSALAVALASQAGVAAPAGLAQMVTGLALAGGTAGVGGAAVLFTMTKLKMGLIATFAAVGATVLTLELKTRQDPPADADRLRLETSQNRVIEKPALPAEVKASVALTPSKSVTEVPVPRTPTGVAAAPEPDPNAGMTPVEKLVNAGRATPGAAFETLTWAALKGDDDELAATLALSNEAREKAAVWRAALPIEDQARFVPLEKLPGLFLAEEALRKAAGMQVLRVTDEEADRATLHVRTWSVGGASSEMGYAMVRGKEGWQMLIPEKMIDGMRRQFEKGGPRSRLKAH